jgi:hypothetical protein
LFHLKAVCMLHIKTLVVFIIYIEERPSVIQ